MNIDPLFFALVGLVFLLAGCPADKPSNDDTSKPADGGTGGATCEAELERAKAELAACQGPPEEPK